jgi:hypothetical protein
MKDFGSSKLIFCRDIREEKGRSRKTITARLLVLSVKTKVLRKHEGFLSQFRTITEEIQAMFASAERRMRF